LTITPADRTAGRVFNELIMIFAASASLKSTADATLKAIRSPTVSNRST
jgi:hypothetical protein